MDKTDRRKSMQKAREKVVGQDTHKIHEWKLKFALVWTNIFHFSTPTMIDYVVHTSCKKGFARSLFKKELFVEKKIYPYWTWMPKKIFVLSETGREVLKIKDKNKKIWTGKINKGHIWHDYLIQFYISKFIFKKQTVYTTYGIKINTHYNKIYDATVLVGKKPKKRIGVEIEISRKKDYEIANMLYNIAKDIQEGNIHEVHIAYDEEVIKNQFTKFMQFSLNEQNKYVFYKYERYNNTNKYKQTFKKIIIPRQDLQIKFIKLEENPRLCPEPKPEPEKEKGVINL